MREQSLSSPAGLNESELVRESGSQVPLAAGVRQGGGAGAEVSFSLATASVSSREASDCRPEAALGQRGWWSGGSIGYTMRKSKDKSEVLESTGTFVSISHSLWPTVIFRGWWLHFCFPKLMQIHFCLTQTQNHTGKGIMRNRAACPSLTQNSPSTSLKLIVLVLHLHSWKEVSWLLICLLRYLSARKGRTWGGECKYFVFVISVISDSLWPHGL